MPKVKTSWVWDFFVSDPKSGDRKCKRCPYMDRSKSTTTAMAVHLRDAHKILRPVTEEECDQPSPSCPPIERKSSSVLRFLTNKPRTVEEWCCRMAVEDGMSFNQIASSEFVAKAFVSFGLRHPQSRTTVSKYVNEYAEGLMLKTKEELVKAFKNGVRFSVVIDKWTSINNRRFLNVCVVTIDSCVNLGLARCRGSMTAIRTVELLQVNFKTTSTVGTYGLRYTAGFVPNYLNPELRICLNFSLSRYNRYLL